MRVVLFTMFDFARALILRRGEIYGNIIKTEPKDTTIGLPVFSACLWLGALSAHNRELRLYPEVTSSGQLFSLCLKERIIPDALDILQAQHGHVNKRAGGTY